jgi:hypothetical protein
MSTPDNGYPVHPVIEGNLDVVDIYGTGQYGLITCRQLNAAVWSGAEPLASGEAISGRRANSEFTQVSGQLLLTYWTAATTGTATTVITGTGGIAGSGLTYAAIGIYSVAGNGNLTLLASTGDLHSTLWASAYSGYTSSLTSSFSRVAGTRYALGVLPVGTTPPSLYGNFIPYWTEQLPPIAGGTVSGLAVLPSTVSAGSVSPYISQDLIAVVAP